MIRLFVGMILGSLSTIVAADGPATADRIMLNASNLMHQSAGQPDSLLMIMSGWGVMALSLSWWKRRQQPVRMAKYSYLLR